MAEKTVYILRRDLRSHGGADLGWHVWIKDIADIKFVQISSEMISELDLKRAEALSTLDIPTEWKLRTQNG